MTNIRFNVHHWNGKDWLYIATAVATNEQEAAKMIASRFSLKGQFSSFPHIDDFQGQATSTTSFTEVA